MANENKIVTELREDFGKGAARKLRAAGKIPAVLYGHGTEPRHLSLPAHEIYLVVRKANAIIDLDIAGESQLALVKDIQRNPVLQGVSSLEHLDLIVVRRGEKVQVEVPVHVEGEPVSGLIVNHETTTLLLEVDALNIPETVVVSVEGLDEGAHILAGAVALPEGATLISEAELLVLGIVAPNAPTAEDIADDLTADEAAEAAANAE